MSDDEQQARRTVAYQLAAYDGLPHAVRLSAAGALETLDEGLDAERARAAMKALSRTVYEFPAGRCLTPPRRGGQRVRGLLEVTQATGPAPHQFQGLPVRRGQPA
ncbi:hypothetical protein [Streptomyces galilaeus]|uniref:hypothetical protein n=1 Tax=Streptomyces galilaeus TaxID=33899 RepID=UPI0038F60E28